MSTFAEILAKAKACQTAAEVDRLLEETVSPTEVEKRILDAFRHFLLQAEAEVKAAKCLTEEEACSAWSNTSADTDSLQEISYHRRYVAIVDSKAPAEALACKTSDEAYLLYEFAPEDSFAEVIYRGRWFELELAEYFKEVASCTTTEEAKVRWQNAKFDGPAEALYGELLAKLEDAEAPARALACQTANDAWELANESSDDGLAMALYKARAIDLSPTTPQS